MDLDDKRLTILSQRFGEEQVNVIIVIWRNDEDKGYCSYKLEFFYIFF